MFLRVDLLNEIDEGCIICITLHVDRDSLSFRTVWFIQSNVCYLAMAID